MLRQTTAAALLTRWDFCMTESRRGYCFTQSEQLTPHFAQNCNKEKMLTQFIAAPQTDALQRRPPHRVTRGGPKNDSHPRHAVRMLKILCKPKQWYRGTRYIRITYVYI